MAATGGQPNTTRSCTSSFVTIRPSIMRLRTDSGVLRPAHRASTSLRVVTCRTRPIPPTSLPIRACGVPLPTICPVSVFMYRRQPRSLRQPPHSVRIWWNRSEPMASYDPNNIFAKILRGELPCYKVYEDDKALAFLDIMPVSYTHLTLPTSDLV